MVKIEEHQAQYESFFKPLLQLANTSHWRYGLNILYCNGNVLNFGEGMNIPVLISMEGNDDGIDKMIDLLKAQSEVDMNSTPIPFIQMFIQKFFPLLSQFSSIFNPNQQKKSTPENIVESIQKTQSLDSEISGILIQAGFLLSKKIAVETFDSLRTKRKIQIDNTLDDENYESMIYDLETIGIINSQLAVSICPHCGNYNLSLSPNPWIEIKCSDCGEAWTTLTLYTFNQPFDFFKSRNSDMSMFISSFLKSKIEGNVEIYPNAKMVSSGKVIEVDVFFPQIDVGFECKSFQDWFMPATSDRLAGMAGHLIPQIANYTSIGIKHIMIITNLTNDTVTKLDPILRKLISEKNIQLNSIAISGRDIDSFVTGLISASKTISETIKNISKDDQKIKNQSNTSS